MDASGAVLPGVTVTASSPVLLQPLVAVTSETGSYQFPQIPIGTYTVQFELGGFRTVLHENVRIEIGFSAQVNAQLEIGAIAETVEVSGAAPLVDIRDTGGRRASTRRRSRTSRRPATRGSSSSSRPASRWTAPTSAARCRVSSRTSSRAAR